MTLKKSLNLCVLSFSISFISANHRDSSVFEGTEVLWSNVFL